MKIFRLSLLALTLLGAVSSARAQLVTKYFVVTGTAANVTANVIETVNATNNTVTIQIDNTIAGPGGAQGVITSFGFDVPFNNGTLGNNGNKTSFTQQWTQLVAGHGEPAHWSFLEPYNFSGANSIFSQNYGVGTTGSTTPINGSANAGIKFGETATFVFSLPDFDTNDIAGFFDTAFDFTIYWQDIMNGSGGKTADIGRAGDLSAPPTQEPAPVPEPTTYGAMGAISLLGLALWRRRGKRV